MTRISDRFEAVRGIHPLPVSEANALDVRHVQQGGYVEINNQTFQVTQLYKYLDVKWGNFGKRRSEYWVVELQLFNVLTGDTRYIEWEVDDELEVSETLIEVKLKDIRYNGSPLTTKSLEEIADEEFGDVVYQGTTYHYSEDDTSAALFSREGEEPLKVRLYEFYSDKGNYLTVEAWEEEDSKPEREAFISRDIDPKAIKIIQCTAVDGQGGGQ